MPRARLFLSHVLPLLLVLLFFTMTVAVPDFPCPAWLKQSGIGNDMASLSYNVSVDPMAPVDLVCGTYTPVHEVGAGGGWDGGPRSKRMQVIG